MLPPIPWIEDFDVSEQHGFLPSEPPLNLLPDPYYRKWEAVIGNLQALILSRRLREVVQKLPVLSTLRLVHRAEWRRAYSILAFITHGYIWGGDVPAERIPPPIAVPFLEVCAHLELPPVATYAGVCLWNFKPIFSDEPLDSLENLATLTTFTGSLDESWFYLVSVAIEARGAPLIPLLLDAVAAARRDDAATVTTALQTFAERMDELGSLLVRMYENCDPHVFYHRIRPFLAGSKNMTEAGLPRGVIYEDGSGTELHRQYGGGSNAQSSLIQFFDIMLGVTHRPTGDKGESSSVSDPSSASETEEAVPTGAPAPPNNFIHEMRSYMPGPHARFLTACTSVANLRSYVLAYSSPTADSHPSAPSDPSAVRLRLAYDAALAMLRALRDRHIQLVSRYIVVQSRASRSAERRSISPRAAPQTPDTPAFTAGVPRAKVDIKRSGAKRGTGGTALIPFLKQARDETGAVAVDAWTRRLLGDRASARGAWDRAATGKGVELGKVGEHADGVVEIVGLAGTWGVDENEGGLCHW